MKKSTREILTVAAVLVGGYFVLQALQPLHLYQAKYPYSTATYQKHDHFRVF